MDTDAAQGPTDEELEIARRRFARGVELADRGEYDEAAMRFEQALVIRDTPAVRFNLASALYEAGRYRESYNHLLHVLEAPDLDPEVRERAERLEDGLRDHVGTLTVNVGGEQGLRIVLDGKAMPEDRLGRQFAVEPGQHVVEAFRDQELISRRELEVQPRTRAVVDMRVVASPQQAAEAAAEPSDQSGEDLAEPTPSGEPRRFGVRDWRLWAVVGGVVVAGAATALALTLTGSGTEEPVPGDFEPGVITWQ